MLNLNLKPKKSKNLKVIEHVGGLYATFDGTEIWRIDRVAYGILKICNGEKTINELIEDVAKKIEIEPKYVKNIIIKILEELQKKRFIEMKKV